MNLAEGRSFRFFSLAGIHVRLHWLWFLVAAYEFGNGRNGYDSRLFNVAEYLGLFLIVLMHEFGHALACRQVGGEANEIVLWPLGGVAYVSPPPRPGALLWSITAGPLVNVALIPVLYALNVAFLSLQPAALPDDAYRLLSRIAFINTSLLIFNLLPIYPLDGGQILRSLLWYLVGPARSLKAASAIGLVGALALVGLAIWQRSLWIGVLAFFMATRSWEAFRRSGAMEP